MADKIILAEETIKAKFIIFMRILKRRSKAVCSAEFGGR